MYTDVRNTFGKTLNSTSRIHTVLTACPETLSSEGCAVLCPGFSFFM